MYGCQCPKRLWLHKNKPGQRDEPDEAQSAIFQQGTDVGLLARQLFPGRVDASPADPYSYQQSVADTARYLEEGHTVIYEAAFQYEGVLCAVDILVRKDGKWYAYEVKSTTGVKDPHKMDAALQYYVITRSGLALADISILHLNNQYIRNGELDLNQLFTPSSALEVALEFQEYVEKKIKELKAVIGNRQEPLIAMGPHCDNPYPCDFQGYCTGDEAEEEPDYGDTYINHEEIRAFTGSLTYPLYFMDFETWSTAVPEYNGHWQYRQVCFQYSVHVQHGSNTDPKQHHYLAEGPHSPAEEFIENLLRVLGTEGSILVYNKTFEQTRLRELQREFPRHAEAIDAILGRISDLMAPFRSHYRLPEMKGSYSIKAVLPALVPELSYADLPIGNGADASTAFYKLKDETDPVKVEATRKALLEYCGLDTLAMVRLLEKLVLV